MSETENNNDILHLRDVINHNIIKTVLKKRFDRREERNKTHYPNFEMCLLTLCKNISKCYDLKTHKLILYKQCKLFESINRKHFPKSSIKADISERELCLILLALREVKIDDSRQLYLFSKLKSLLPHNIIIEKEKEGSKQQRF